MKYIALKQRLLWFMNQFDIRNWHHLCLIIMSRKIIRYKIVGWMRDKEIRHKRGYHTYSDVIFGWVAWIWVSISDFFAEYLHLLSWLVLKFKNHDFTPPPPPAAPAPFAQITTKGEDTQQKSPRYSTKSTRLSQK